MVLLGNDKQTHKKDLFSQVNLKQNSCFGNIVLQRCIVIDFFINPCFKPFRRGVLELTCCGALSEDKSSWPCHVDFNKKQHLGIKYTIIQ